MFLIVWGSPQLNTLSHGVKALFSESSTLALTRLEHMGVVRSLIVGIALLVRALGPTLPTYFKNREC